MISKTIKTTLFALLVLSIAVPTASMVFAADQNITATDTITIKDSVKVTKNITVSDTITMKDSVKITVNSSTNVLKGN